MFKRKKKKKNRGQIQFCCTFFSIMSLKFREWSWVMSWERGSIASKLYYRTIALSTSDNPFAGKTIITINPPAFAVCDRVAYRTGSLKTNAHANDTSSSRLLRRRARVLEMRTNSVFLSNVPFRRSIKRPHSRRDPVTK